MTAQLSMPGESNHSRAVSIRYFNLYRIVVASAFAIFGAVFSFGQKAPAIFMVTIIAYWVMAFAFLLLHAGSPHYGERSLGLQTALDILMLSVFMSASGGFRSGIPFLMMTSIAGAGLVGQGRMVLGAASLATMAVLLDQAYRALVDNDARVDFSQAAIICVGFFAVAMVARLLARRALANEALAHARGFDLARQMQVNARIIKDMQDGVLVLDHAGAVRQINPRAGELLGLSLSPDIFLAQELPILASIALQDTTEESVQFVAPHTGKTLNVRRILIDKDQRHSDVLLYLEDMDRVQARARQIKLAALGRLTANIAHEIRNPLSAVSHAGELLLEEKRQSVQERLVRIIHDNAARIERMVRDVLELGQRDRLTLEVLDVAQFCRGFVEEFSAPKPQIAPWIRLEMEEGVMLQFDRLHLYQIFANLIGNASRYCSQQPASIVLSAHALDEHRVLISVSDDGPGIPESERAKVFEPFFTSDPKGSGLGLYMARELAEANSAELSLVDAPGGAVFHLIVRRVV